MLYYGTFLQNNIVFSQNKCKIAFPHQIQRKLIPPKVRKGWSGKFKKHIPNLNGLTLPTLTSPHSGWHTFFLDNSAHTTWAVDNRATHWTGREKAPSLSSPGVCQETTHRSWDHASHLISPPAPSCVWRSWPARLTGPSGAVSTNDQGVPAAEVFRLDLVP